MYITYLLVILVLGHLYLLKKDKTYEKKKNLIIEHEQPDHLFTPFF